MDDEARKREISRVFQEAVVGHLCTKVGHAMASLKEPVGGLVVSGGVASNQYLRQVYVCPFSILVLMFRLQETMIKLNPKSPISLYFPPIQLCTGKSPSHLGEESS